MEQEQKKEILSESMQQIMKENEERNTKEDERRNEIYKKEMWNYFHGKPIGEGLPEGYNPEKQYQQMEKHYNDAHDYERKIKESVGFDEYGKYYIHPQTEGRVYFTHPDELPTLDNEYPENDTIQPEWVRMPQPPHELTEEERIKFAPMVQTENGLEPQRQPFKIPNPETLPEPELKDTTHESVNDFIKAVVQKEMAKIYYKK